MPVPSSVRRTLSHNRSWPLNRNHRHPPTSSLRRRHSPWRNPLLRFLAFFFLGSLIGLSHPGHSPTSSTITTPLPLSSSSHHSDPNPIHIHKRTSRAINSNNNVESSLPTKLVIKSVKPVEPEPSLPTKLVIVVTPTYNRLTQAYFLHRLGQTLRLVRPPLLWIVVEVGAASHETADILRRTGVMYRHLICPRAPGGDNFKDRGTRQRNAALEHIEMHRMDGVVYFADDDNVYSVDLFDKLREIR